MYRRLSTLLLILLALTLSGCGESVELHRNISEQEANEIIAELADKQIRAQKIQEKTASPFASKPVTSIAPFGHWTLWDFPR